MAKDTNNKNKKTLLEKLKYKYRLIIINEDTFEQKTSLRLSRMNLYVLGSVLFLLMVCFVTAIIAFTPLKFYLPGVGSIDVRSQLVDIEMLTDSLTTELDKRNYWLGSFQKALSGELDSTFFINDSLHYNDVDHVDIIEASKEEQDFKEAIKEEIEKSELVNKVSIPSDLSSNYLLKFISPVNGVVIAEFDKKNEHFGIDIATEEGEGVRSVEAGVVVSSHWNPETGNVIIVQHKNNALSFYMHNSKLLKKVGNFVRKGEVIALVGNTGEMSDGPHLHFELWQSGKAVDPLSFIEISKI